jgi:dynein heavy chain, axonemal
VKSFNDYKSIASDRQKVEAIERTIKNWIEKITEVVVKSEQIRQETHQMGPRDELNHWFKRSRKFNYLIDQIKSLEVKSALGILKVAKSNLVEKWRDIDQKLTNNDNEAKDNIKYLSTLENICLPLYKGDPVQMINDLPNLLKIIEQINFISLYYNTPENLSSLLCKITNQMIVSCKVYIQSTEKEKTLFSQPQEIIIRKMNQCIDLNKEYKRCYNNFIDKIANKRNDINNKNNSFSKILIFGNFNTFVTRLEKILDIIKTINSYSKIKESKMDGMSSLASVLYVQASLFKNKTYDFLDTKNSIFENDYKQFKKAIDNLQTSLIHFIDKNVDSMKSSQSCLKLLKRFESFKLPNIDFKEEKYSIVWSKYWNELSLVVQKYQKEYLNPPIERDVPDITGRILWARQLYKYIETPMLQFKDDRKMMKNSETKKIVTEYNRVAIILIEYEMLYHKTWLKNVDIVYSSLNSTILVKGIDQICVNFDPDIFTLIRDVPFMINLDLKISNEAKSIFHNQELIKMNYRKIKVFKFK